MKERPTGLLYPYQIPRLRASPGEKQGLRLFTPCAVCFQEFSQVPPPPNKSGSGTFLSLPSKPPLPGPHFSKQCYNSALWRPCHKLPLSATGNQASLEKWVQMRIYPQRHSMKQWLHLREANTVGKCERLFPLVHFNFLVAVSGVSVDQAVLEHVWNRDQPASVT